MPSPYLEVFRSRRLAVILLLGFSSGLPLALTGGTLQAWMTVEGVDLSTIGVFTLVGLPYVWKFLWAPAMDRFVPPFLGRRRGWLLATQFALVVGIAGMAFLSPRTDLVAIAWLALFVAFASASQDIVVDAYRTDVASREQRGLAGALGVVGYRLAMLASGALALVLVAGSGWIPALGWRNTYLLMAALMAVGVLAVLWGEEPSAAPDLARCGDRAPARILLPAQSRLDPGAARALQARGRVRRVADHGFPLARRGIFAGRRGLREQGRRSRLDHRRSAVRRRADGEAGPLSRAPRFRNSAGGVDTRFHVACACREELSDHGVRRGLREYRLGNGDGRVRGAADGAVRPSLHRHAIRAALGARLLRARVRRSGCRLRDRPQVPGALVGDVFFPGFHRRASRAGVRVVLAQGD